jgi:hypothetical protein
MSLTFTVKRVRYHFTLASLVSHIVHVTLIIRISACAWYSHGLPLEVFSVEAFRFLLSSYVSHLLSKETLVTGSMSSVIMGAPELEVRVVYTRLVYTFAAWLVES